MAVTELVAAPLGLITDRSAILDNDNNIEEEMEDGTKPRMRMRIRRSQSPSLVCCSSHACAFIEIYWSLCSGILGLCSLSFRHSLATLALAFGQCLTRIASRAVHEVAWSFESIVFWLA